MRRLILRPGGIGDFIVSLPALEWLRADYTEVWTSSANVPLARFADRARPIPSTGIDIFGLPGQTPPAALIETLGGFDSIISWYGANRPEFREAMLGLGVPVQFHQALPAGGCHATDFYLRQAGAPEGGVPRLAVTAPRDDFIAIHPFSGGRHKNWPLDNFRAVAAELPVQVRWTAGPEEPLAQATRFDCLWELAQWLASARLYIGNDSGVMHLAAAAGTPVIAIFGPTDPAVWAPRGSHVRVARWPQDPAAVAELAAGLIRG